MDILGRLRDAAQQVFTGAPVRFAYLFGSHARGTAGDRSDIDVAVMLDDAVPEVRRLELQLELAEALERATGLSPVEVVLLNDAPMLLAGRVVQEGQLLYSADEPARVAYESLTFRQYVDFDREMQELERARLRAHARGER